MTPGLENILQNWASVYSNHAALRTSIGFVHVAGLISGGGAAVVADRTTLVASRLEPHQRLAHISTLRATHRTVLIGLAAVIASGILLFAADYDTYLHSRLFWLKMGLIAVLLVNGAVLARTGIRATRDDRAWPWLRRTAWFSMTLWFLTTLVGAALPNIG